MNKRKRLINNIQYVLDTENHFYHWELNLEFKHSTDEYKFNSSEMRFLLEVNNFNDFFNIFFPYITSNHIKISKTTINICIFILNLSHYP